MKSNYMTNHRAKFFLAALAASAITSGCATGTYRPPEGQLQKGQHERTVKKSFDETWSALIDHTSKTFFGIDKFEKASGLMTLTFGASNPQEFINCGRMEIQAPGTPRDGNHNYAEYLSRFTGAKLDGRMNLLVKPVSATETAVRVNARYIFSVPASASSPSSVFSFESDSEATIQVDNAIAGTTPTRTCRPTLAAEKAILNGIEK